MTPGRSSVTAGCKRVLLLLCAWTLLACQPQALPTETPGQEPATDAAEERLPERKPATKGSIGTPCQAQEGCQDDLLCETRIPKGYCTKTCKVTTDCPHKSACVRIKFQDGPAFLRCLRTCHTNADCREDFYCYHPPGAWKLICLPNEAKPSP